MGNKNKDLYSRLDVDEKATREQIKKAYRKKAKKMHPDVGGSNEEFALITEAFAVLYNNHRRAEYDRMGSFNDVPEERRIKEAAVTNLCSLFKGVVDENGKKVLSSDVITIMKSFVSTVIGEHKSGIENLNKKKELYKNILKRIMYVGDEFDALSSIVEEDLKSIEFAINNLMFDIKVSGKILEILDDYKFVYIIRMPVVNNGDSFFTATTTPYEDINLKHFRFKL